MRELFLASFSGIQYGIWKDEILSVRDIRALHRIPLSPPRIAGIMIDGDRTVTLADLPACIGHEPTLGAEQGCILLKQEGDKVIGFVVSGELRVQSISLGLVFPLPDYLKTPVFDTCAVHDGIPIPVINIAEIYSRALKAGDVLSVDSLRIPGAQAQDISGMSRVRFFVAGGELFAVPAAGIGDRAVKPGPITPLPGTPLYVKGVTFRDGRLLPVIDLPQRINSQRVAPDSVMLAAGIADAAFGLLVDSDAGTLSADKVSTKPAPLIAQTSWLKYIVVRAGEFIPLIDPAMALAPGSGAADEKPIWQRYAPDSGFPDIFFRHEAEVVEFSLLGERYALPKQEVEDVIACKPCRALPDVPPIVIGVAEHNGEILPVVDLAMMFGRRSLATPEWRMMLVNNGDFRALVITETVFGERRLALDIHRAVPVHLPHNLTYGCYPDGNAVRIILNVEAISVHFEKSLIQIFMPALSQQMRMSPTGVVYKFPEEKAEPEGKIGPEEKVNETPPPSVTDVTAETAPPASAEAEPGVEAAGVNEEPAGQEFIAAETSQATPEFKRQAEIADAEFVEWEQETSAPISPESGQTDMVDAAVPKQIIVPETAAAEGSPEHHASVHDVSDREQSAAGSKAREPAAMSKQSPLEALRASIRSKQAQKLSSTAAVKNRPAEPMRATANAKAGTPYRMSREVEHFATLPGYAGHTAGTWKRSTAFGTVAVLLAAASFYFAGTTDKPVAGKSIQATKPAKIAQAQAEQVKEETVPVRTTAEPPRPAEISRPPLELDIPKNRPTDIDVYVVQEGDTLWSISERFTGNPYNYPRIAGENRIADPDLIFPGQRIRLIK
ncbi:MAG: chemotaxis protein CheW [Pseudomonadota bacterium]